MRIVLIGNIPKRGRPVLARELGAGFEFREYTGSLAELRNAEVIVGSPVNAEIVAAAPRLRLVHTPGAGYDSIDLAALPASVPLCQVFHHERAMAEHVMLMILALDRNLLRQDAELRRGNWGGSCATSEPEALELEGRTVGIVGFGHIGREVARLAEPFGMHVKGVRSADPPEALGALLAESDFVVLTLPLTARSRGLINGAALKRMKPDACLINVARGEVADEAHLFEALRSRRIRGAAIDVWYVYPRGGEPCLPSRYPFHELDNVILTPHSSAWTERVRQRRFRDIAANIKRLAAGAPLVNVVSRP